MATAKRRGNLALYDEIEQEIEYMKDPEVFSLSPYKPDHAPIKTAKGRLDKSIETAEPGSPNRSGPIAHEVLRDGDVEGARELEHLAEQSEPDGTKEETKPVVLKLTLDAISVLEGDWGKNLPKARQVRRFSTSNGYRQTFATHSLEPGRFHDRGGDAPTVFELPPL